MSCITMQYACPVSVCSVHAMYQYAVCMPCMQVYGMMYDTCCTVRVVRYVVFGTWCAVRSVRYVVCAARGVQHVV